MRFLETLLIVIAAIYLAQLAITILVLTTILFALWCLYTRPKEALLLGAGLLAVAFFSTPVGLATLLALAVGLGLWRLCRRFRTPRPRLAPYRPRGDL